MQIKSIKNSSYNINSSFKQQPQFKQFSVTSGDYTKKQKAVVATTTTLGVITSLAILSKLKGNTLNPKKFKKIKDSYLAKVRYEWPEVTAIGAGSCIGGLIGGCLIDKNKENRRAKQREAIMHFGNIAIPIFTVGMLVDKVFRNSNKWVKAGAGFGGIAVGLYLANFITNKVSNFVFKDKSQERGIEITDLPAHLDDAVVSASYIFPESKMVHGLGRIIPIALMVAGNEVGNARAHH